MVVSMYLMSNVLILSIKIELTKNIWSTIYKTKLYTLLSTK